MRVTVGMMFQYSDNNDDPLWVFRVVEVGHGIAYCESYHAGASQWETSEIREGISNGSLKKYTLK